MAWVRICLAILTSVTLLGCASQADHETLRFEGLETTPKSFGGILTLPEGKHQRVPVVVLVHGTAGPDSRYEFHRPALLEAGIGTLEVDFKTNIFTDPSTRPPVDTFQPWAFGALKALRAHPRVASKRIAIMGFSLGGHVSISVASSKVVNQWLDPDQEGFTAHVGFYPACKWLKKHFDATGATGTPILIISGEKDSWGDGEACPLFCDWLSHIQPDVVSLTMYPNVHHGFDRQGSWKGFAPYAKDKTATLQWDDEAARDSRKRAIAFLRQAFGM